MIGDYDEVLLFASLAEWAKITVPDTPGVIDQGTVQRLVSGVLGEDWQVRTGTGSATPGVTPHLPYMCVSSGKYNCNVLVIKGSNVEGDNCYWGWCPTEDTWEDFVRVNFKADLVAYPPIRNLSQGKELVHSGYLNAWQALNVDVTKLVYQTQPRVDAKLYVVGHSMGGALAQMFFVGWLLHCYDQLSGGFDPRKGFFRGFIGPYDYTKPVAAVHAVTFGAPRIGNDALWTEVQAAVTAVQKGLLDQKMWSVNIQASFYELRNELFGSSDDGLPGLYAIADPLGNYAAGPYETTLPYPNQDDWSWPNLGGWGRNQMVGHFKTDLGGPDGHSVVLTGDRPSDWESIRTGFVFDLSGASELLIESIVLYLDDQEVWRKEQVSITQANLIFYANLFSKAQ